MKTSNPEPTWRLLGERWIYTPTGQPVSANAVIEALQADVKMLRDRQHLRIPIGVQLVFGMLAGAIMGAVIHG